MTSHTNAYGAPVALTGTVSTNGAYPASGTVITVTINGTPQTTTLSDSTGDFSINYNTTGLPASATPYTVAYSSPAGGGFNAATNTSTTLTIVARPQMGDISVSGTQFIFSYPTVLGQTYQLQYTTDLSSGVWFPAGSPVPGTGAPVWTTNSIVSSIAAVLQAVRVCNPLNRPPLPGSELTPAFPGFTGLTKQSLQFFL